MADTAAVQSGSRGIRITEQSIAMSVIRPIRHFAAFAVGYAAAIIVTSVAISLTFVIVGTLPCSDCGSWTISVYVSSIDTAIAAGALLLLVSLAITPIFLLPVAFAAYPVAVGVARCLQARWTIIAAGVVLGVTMGLPLGLAALSWIDPAALWKEPGGTWSTLVFLLPTAALSGAAYTYAVARSLSAREVKRDQRRDFR